MLIRTVDRPLDVLPADLWNALFAANAVLIDELITGLQELSQGVPVTELAIIAWLPPRYVRGIDEFFLRRFLVCLASVGLKMRLPDFHPAACLAEEVAIFATLQCAQTLAAGHDARDFAPWREQALRSGAIEALYTTARDESADRARGESAAKALDQWFIPFSSADAAHPYVSDAARPDWACQ